MGEEGRILNKIPSFAKNRVHVKEPSMLGNAIIMYDPRGQICKHSLSNMCFPSGAKRRLRKLILMRKEFNPRKDGDATRKED